MDILPTVRRISRSHCQVNILLFIIDSETWSPIVSVCVECALLEYPVKSLVDIPCSCVLHQPWDGRLCEMFSLCLVACLTKTIKALKEMQDFFIYESFNLS